MKRISDILKQCKVVETIGRDDRLVASLAFDSRKCSDEVAFFAIKGTQVDGHDFIGKAIELNCKVVVCETLPETMADDVTYYRVENSAEALGYAASEFYGRPSEKLRLVGVTGTNGKTTIATLLYRLFYNAGYPCGLLSTIENRINNVVVPSTHTTGDQLQINEMLSRMVEAGCEYAFMEVSSHAIDQDRIAGLRFEGGIFTNLTHDHLDYHKTVAAYRDAKKKFFDRLPSSAFALTNLDDKNGMVMLQNTKAKKQTYSLRTDADFKGVVMESYFDGMELKINRNNISTFLVGRFNVSNLLAIYGAASLLGMSDDDLLKEVSKLQSAPGRFQMVHSESGVIGIVDYAHTPDALKNVLDTINEIRTHNETLITVAGAGGNRDAAKRPEMAAVAVSRSDRFIITSDNPRNEEPEEIIRQMREGVGGEYYNKVLSITDRREAIRTAAALAKKGDIILVAGKGHENYQEIKGVRHHFDDVEELSKALNEKLN
ncbi:MAG: UDP-N-acetylmuramoyl-L-alanyl-D-glutamate--2,6-diaminopimelate ligase [Bacteroidales bacterium]|nr:UDP-N-acetylmuramoyl-L-alanyl-D-glutamate--2,6-diaminopimelate ligase [Bacteroidales bacterium]MBR5781399.1 UDP-N-acetylmuramoyl-L-alanyl-D-glutamate--2,6-diaminopimelate ligase [Bacteroidales bacterium]